MEYAQNMNVRKAIAWTVFWILCALLMNAGIYYYWGPQKAMEFLAGYVIEESLSVDNLFVFLIIFGYFKISPSQQRRALNYGIMGVILLRGVMIYLGSTLVTHFEWILYVFGLILLYSGYKIAFGGEIQVQPENNLVIRMFKKIMPVKASYTGNKFFIHEHKKWFASPLLIALIVIETTDVVFAIDSIPAVFGITTDPVIVFSSNFMAVLGLRSIYFILEKLHNAFVYVKYGVGLVLVFVGAKMLIAHIYPIATLTSLCVVISILSLSVILSAVKNARSPAE
jgi:tellurite resistance protein TerC